MLMRTTCCWLFPVFFGILDAAHLLPPKREGKHNCCYFRSSWRRIKFLHSNICISLPTFIIAECVLIYLDPDSSSAVVGWASKTFSTAVFFLYEQVRCLPKPKIIVWCFLCLCTTDWFQDLLIFLASFSYWKIFRSIWWPSQFFPFSYLTFYFNRFILMMLLGSRWLRTWRSVPFHSFTFSSQFLLLLLSIGSFLFGFNGCFLWA